MNLEKNCSAYFTNGIRQRGSNYFLNKAVRITTSQDRLLVADVRGSDDYEVKLFYQNVASKPLLFIDCTCPYFLNGGDGCKHIWAVILAAAAQHWPKDVADRGAIEVVCLGDDYDDDEVLPDDDNFWEEPDFTDQAPSPPAARRMPEPQPALRLKLVHPAEPPALPGWQQLFPELPSAASRAPSSPQAEYITSSHPRPREIRYAVNLAASRLNDTLTIDLFQREQKANGDWGAVKALRVGHDDLHALTDYNDQKLLALMLGSKSATTPAYDSYYSYQTPKHGSFQIVAPAASTVLTQLASTGRLHLLVSSQDKIAVDTPLRVDSSTPAALALVLRPHPQLAETYLLEGQLGLNDEFISLSNFKSCVGDHLAVFSDRIVFLQPLPVSHALWLNQLATLGGTAVPAADLDLFVQRLTKHPAVPRLVLPAESGWTQQTSVLKPRLSILASPSGARTLLLQARILFDYDGECLRPQHTRSCWATATARTLWQRNAEAERQLITALMAEKDLVPIPAGSSIDADLAFPATRLASLTETLNSAGWTVEAEGKLIRAAHKFKAFVASGIDWFDLEASCHFDDHKIELPQLLQALKRGESFVRLDDGTYGLLPLEWLNKFADLTAFSGLAPGKIRFSRPQVVFLDALLEQLPAVDVDDRFRTLRDQVKLFNGVAPKDPGPAFQGQLRDYQREGLGWLNFLADFGFGGCLADDMGLGKTVQVLAMLQDRKLARHEQSGPKPTLIVLPRSLVHNWKNEAKRFTPKLTVLDLTTADRAARWQDIGRHDVVLTTYAMMRLDIDDLRKISFDYCILDEAQAIKNDSAQVAKAARLLQADHRLAMSGTPVENHLGELGSIFAFLNPGMLSPALVRSLSQPRPGDSAERSKLLAKALRPFILRRTKEQVLKDLPAKTEQVIYCDLDQAQRKMYDQLREHYRLRLNKTIAAKGVAKSQIEVLEALLRLRQAACHPGLIDRSMKDKPSAKLEILMEQIRSVVDGGHKALVFSQFTSMLALVKSRLEEEDIPFEYLDGRARNREAKVERFQTDPAVPVFLISLKAGGVGLNLTAADYCFILDPWWNPAAEAQAIDRAHRIGQTRHVFAYKLIAKDTVEEKILALQDKKRDLASAIVSVENSHVRGLTLDDVELLLS